MLVIKSKKLYFLNANETWDPFASVLRVMYF